MGISRGHFVGASVLLVLMLSSTQALPHSNEDSSKRNSLSDASDFKVLRCLFVDKTLPICDPNWWSPISDNSVNNHKKRESYKYTNKDRISKRKHQLDLSDNTRIVVHAFKNCLPTDPERLRGMMPFCDELLSPTYFDKIDHVEMFDPFVIEGLPRVPYFFPSRPKNKKTVTMVGTRSTENLDTFPAGNVFRSKREVRIPDEVPCQAILIDTKIQRVVGQRFTERLGTDQEKTANLPATTDLTGPITAKRITKKGLLKDAKLKKKYRNSELSMGNQ